MRRAGLSTVRPGAPDDAFEREVLRASGWVSAMAVNGLTAPDQGLAAKLDLIYNPPGSDRDGEGKPKVGPLREDVLAKEPGCLPVTDRDPRGPRERRVTGRGPRSP